MSPGHRSSVVAVSGFGDSEASWHPFLRTDVARRHRVEVVELSDLARGPAETGGLDAMVAIVSDVIGGGADSPVILIGHSLGSVVAVRVARAVPDEVAGVLSIEGNLTNADGYFSATAADHEDPAVFHIELAARVRRLVELGHAPQTYLEAIQSRNPRSLWELGIDSARSGRGDAFGDEFLSLPGVPTRYLWCPASTPAPTRRFLATHGIDERSHPTAGHWPFHDEPGWVARELTSFADSLASGDL